MKKSNLIKVMMLAGIIIEQNTTKVDTSRYPYSIVSDRPNGTWNQYCGYGLINAYEAVKNTPRW